MFKNNTVGIMTGDIKFSPNADIVVMTTEILRNLLYKKGSITENLGLTASLSLENLDSVIFDECHYINNKERGSVWEETMILLPKEINLVLLSATIDSADLFASWLGELKQKPIHLISTTYRIVPLEHYIIKRESFETVMELTSRSFMSPDIRTAGDPNKIAIGETGTCHKKIGYIACRLLKSISYGQLGITNSRHAYELLDKKVIYNDDERQLFHDAKPHIGNHDLIKEQMKIVKENHTWLNRIEDLLKVLDI
jgi:Lhr-like helicase